MTLAKNLDREGLSSVINLLRRARNEVVWIIGGIARSEIGLGESLPWKEA